MVDHSVIDRVRHTLVHGSPGDQAACADDIRSLASDKAYQHALEQSEILQPLIGLIGDKASSPLPALQALKVLSVSKAVQEEIVQAEGLESLLALLHHDDSDAEQFQAALAILLEIATQDSGRLAIAAAGGVSNIANLLEGSAAEGTAVLACQLLGRLGLSSSNKDRIREQLGIIRMLTILQQPSTTAKLRGAVLQALSILVADKELNQNQVVERYGLASILKMLDPRLDGSVAVAATTFLTALCLNHDSNKDVAREQWALPLLVNNLDKEDPELVEQTVDCLRVLTTGNQFNKLALISIPAALRSLVQIMISSRNPTMVERSAAVLGNLSQTEQFFGAIRERGGLQRLVELLDSGPSAKITEIAAKTLANLATNANSRKSIRLAGGVPPLVNLLTQRPNAEVMMACEEALRRLEVVNVERNAILETLRYCEQQKVARLSPVPEAAEDLQNGSTGGEPLRKGSRPFTQFSVEDTCELLGAMGIQNTEPFRDNGVTGGDLLDLSPDDLKLSLNLTTLQARKISTITASFEAFTSIALSPGKAEINSLELREWLQKQGLSAKDQQAVINGFKDTEDNKQLAVLSFRDFALRYQWLCKILEASNKTS